MTRRRRTIKRDNGSQRTATDPVGERHAIGTGEFTLTDEAGEPIGLQAFALIGARRISFYDVQGPSDLPCAVAELPDAGTLLYLARGYEERLSSAEPFLAGFALGMYQAYVQQAQTRQHEGPGA